MECNRAVWRGTPLRKYVPVARDRCNGTTTETIGMGAYFLIVNPAKRQYLDPSRFGEAIKFSAVLRGDYCVQALKLLIADCFQRDATSFPGAWLGDPVILASDDTGLPNPAGLVTEAATDPTRNLHAWARAEFTNISYRALAELCLDTTVAAELAARAKSHSSLLIDLIAMMEQYRPRGFELVLEQAVGRPWRKAYNKALDDCSYWLPLPPIEWPL
jgi:hypothetical protein